MGKPHRTTAARGYGWNRHQKPRERLLYNLTDGQPCEYCGQPMYRDPDRNFDHAVLEADHIDADKSQPPGRLIHRKCNRTLNSVSRWVRHGPGWYARYGGEDSREVAGQRPAPAPAAGPTQDGRQGGLDWPKGQVINW